MTPGFRVTLSTLLKKVDGSPGGDTPSVPAEPTGPPLDPMPYEVSFSKKLVSSEVKNKMLAGIVQMQDDRVERIIRVAGERPEFRKEYLQYAEDVRALADGSTFVAVPSERIKSIVADGRLKTVHEKVVSMGGNDGEGKNAPGYLSARREYENSMLVDPKRVKPAGRPVYGYVGKAPGTSGSWQGKPSSSVTSYGDVHFELKPSARGRTSLTFGDSLNAAATPVMADRVGEASPDEVVRASLPSELYWPSYTSVDPAKQEHYDTSKLNVGYVEAQVYGGVSLADIAVAHVDWNTWRDRLDEYRDKADNATTDYAREQALKVHGQINRKISEIKAAIKALEEAGIDVRRY